MNQPCPPPNSPISPNSTIFGLAQSLEKLDSLLEGPYINCSCSGCGPATPKSTSTGAIKGTSSICSTTSDSSAAMTKTTMHNAPSEAASRRASQITLETQCSDPAISAPPAQSTEPTQTLQTAPMVAASVSTEHRPRLWSQLLKKPGSSTETLRLKPRSESSIDEANWPSLGSCGPNDTRKRNRSS
ncbi:hypothetical protein GGR58DRAFT_473840 [Xylaria digitata]|nr:hypothetical protein GGR58DRAFT_473840 [Xylaria digitata]